MATSKITPDQDAIICEIHIAAQPEHVFQALTDPRQVTQWWGGKGPGQSYRCTRFESDLRVGGRWLSAGTTDSGTFQVTGEYLEIDPPRLLVYTWTASWTGAVTTTVRWELKPADQGTLVTLRHTGLAAHPELAQSYRGWPMILGWLQIFVESGKTVETRQETA
jgi:uncharacterized protein YndB with AHSA1/START domain